MLALLLSPPAARASRLPHHGSHTGDASLGPRWGRATLSGV